MDLHTINLLQGSFSEVRAAQDDAASLFYERLFRMDPSLEKLFDTSDMRTQGRKLMTSLALVVDSLRRFDDLKPVLENLARKHVTYGVQNAHYETVGNALIETLSLFFGERFSPELRAAWAQAYAAIAGVMLAAVPEEASLV